MKPRNLTIGYALVLLMLLGVGVITIQTASAIGVTADCKPFFISLEDPIPQEFRITLKLPKPYKHEDIDPDSILVGGVVPMKEAPDWPKVKKNFFLFKVDGEQLMYLIVLPQIWHMQISPHTRVDIDVTVTGQLYGGEEFDGTFTLTIFTEKPEYDNPHPPP